MNTLKNHIFYCLQQFSRGALLDNALTLFNALGYRSDIQMRLAPNTAENFLEHYDAYGIFDAKHRQRVLLSEWKSIDFLFQLTAAHLNGQSAIFQVNELDAQEYQSYLFFALELQGDAYPRGALAVITREINQLFMMPALILFKHGDALTFSIINRRLSKTDAAKDVLEKVTLIKDIAIERPHRAHIEILFDLSCDELRRVHKFTNFSELHQAWQKTLDTRELNQQFYQKLFNWYVWALQSVKFPQIRPESDVVKDRVHQSESLIRLLTRLLFVWFMKEKGLIPENLFDPRALQAILKDFQGQGGEQTIYYTAILQNLFFATLNQPREKRKVLDSGFNPREYGDPLVYRHAQLFREPDKLLSYFEKIPFLNGGLFECLDQKKDAEHPSEIRLDGFSSKKEKQPVFPDKYFFGHYADIDLSAASGDQKKKAVAVTGLIDILQQYKFTIEENTPVEEEIALDPELLGKVFENLLASYNPETQTTARKQTGSFYTPREIVNYMVDESLLAYLENCLNYDSSDGHDDHGFHHENYSSDIAPRLRALLAYTAEPPEFNEVEHQTLMTALENCKVLDPACGSGAFPMGMLQKMIHVLRGLDPDNRRWLEMVIQKFPPAARAKARERLEQENWNYVRKLGIIQQCIYGVDLQPIATQIAKLRFFISLLVDQKVNPAAPNQGLEPLPNLDFKIVTANTLIAAPQAETANTDLFAQQIDPFFPQFEALTSQYFTASLPADKNRLKHKIEALLKQKTATSIQQIEQNFKTALDSRYNAAKAQKHAALIAEKEREIALWRSYPNLFKHEAVGFFEPRYFFPNVSGGFDIVIGNPPYGAKFSADQKKLFYQLFKHQDYQLDSYLLFTEKAFDLAKNQGTISFIIPNPWLTNLKLKKIRKLIVNEHTILNITHYHKSVFDATVDTEVVFFKNQTNHQNRVTIIVHEKGDNTLIYAVSQEKWKRLNGEPINIFIDEKTERVVSKLQQNSLTLGSIGNVVNGMKPYEKGKGNPAQTQKMVDERIYDAEYQIDKTYKPVLRGRDIEKYLIKWNGTRWIKYGDNLGAPRYSANFDADEKIVIRQTGDCLIATLDTTQFVCMNNMHVITQKNKEFDLKYILALLNSRVLDFYYQTLNPEKGEALAEVKKENVEKLLIKNIPLQEQQPFITLVDQVLAAKQRDHAADTRALENEIDWRVYALYGLTEEEIAIVEGGA